MKVFCVITLLVSLQAGGQESRTDEREKIYQHIVLTHVDQESFVINETFTPVNKYDIDGNYQRWFYRQFSDGKMVSAVPVQYESTVYDFLQSQNISLDTSSIFQQVDAVKLDSLSKYKTSVKLISFNKAPLGHSFLRNLFKMKSAVGLSPIYFEEKNHLAFVKLQVYSKRKQSAANLSKIIILQKQGDEWKTFGILYEKLQPTTVLQKLG